jgi:hypothetical protein
LYHQEEDSRLDWWERGDTQGNRRLRDISELLKQGFCHKACPTRSFPQGKYRRPLCCVQMNIEVENEVADGDIGGKEGIHV